MAWDSEIDWAASGIWFQGWVSLANAGAVITAALIATNTYKNWLMQRQAENRLGVAEEVMTLIYKSKDIFSSIRAPFSMSAEVEVAEGRLRESNIDFDNLAEAKRRRYVSSQIALDRVVSNK